MPSAFLLALALIVPAAPGETVQVARVPIFDGLNAGALNTDVLSGGNTDVLNTDVFNTDVSNTDVLSGGALNTDALDVAALRPGNVNATPVGAGLTASTPRATPGVLPAEFTPDGWASTASAPTSDRRPAADDLDFSVYAASPAGALCACCGDLCFRGCFGIVDRNCFGGKLAPAVGTFVAVTFFGAALGCGAGVVVGLIPAIIFGVLSYSGSINNGASVDDAASAAQASFFLTDALVGLVGMGLGTLAGGITGAFMGMSLFVESPPPPARRPRNREVAPSDPYEELPPEEDPDSPPGDAPPGDAPPPMAIRF